MWAEALLAAVLLATRTADDGTVYTVTEHTVRVPELREGPNAGGTIDLAVVRVSRSEKPARVAHVVLAGGPGDSGVNLVLNLAQRGGATLFDLFGADIIGIDQRGTGKSSPNLQVQRRYGLPLDKPGSPELWLPLIDNVSRQVAAELAKKGVRLEAYNTRESADDVEAVRRALGYERIVLWGRSYGSHLALATLRRHPKSIERVILANPEGPDHTLKLPSLVDEVLARYDLTESVKSVLADLDESQVSRFELQLLIANALGDPRTAKTLPDLLAEIARGDYRRLVELATAQRWRMGVQSAMKQMMDVSSGATRERRARIEREAAASPLGNAINFPLWHLHDTWSARDLGDYFRKPVRSDVPVLVLAGDLDPRTPVENGREIVKHLRHGRLVVVPGGGHQFDLFGSAEMRQLLKEFLAGRRR